MELKERIRLYLKTRKQPVSREELLRVSASTGVSKGVMYDLIRNIQDLKDYDDCDIGVWWGYFGNHPNTGEGKTLWLKFYEIDPQTKKNQIRALKWFDKLP